MCERERSRACERERCVCEIRAECVFDWVRERHRLSSRLGEGELHK